MEVRRKCILETKPNFVIVRFKQKFILIANQHIIQGRIQPIIKGGPNPG